MKRFTVVAIDVDIPLNPFGDHDPEGKMYVLRPKLDEVRAQERTQKVTLGLRDDPIQPLVIRANRGDCVVIDFRNRASGGPTGMHIDGLAFKMSSSGDAVGRNASSAVARGGSRTYRFFVPNRETLEGAHYIHPGPGNRHAVAHGLFGALSVQPPGSRYRDPTTGRRLRSGWEAMIVPRRGAAYREPVLLHHEVGTESEDIITAEGGALPQVDPHSDAYRPGSRALNYRSEPFFNRLEETPEGESHSYGSYTFGDPATPIPRSYQSDPEKIRIVHAGSEMFHVYHLHGGGIRWRFNPDADPTFDYADTGLDKRPVTNVSRSARLDSQSIGPGESYNLEIEGGAGGVQQAAGDFLFHCHIAEHYVAGMWSFWRVYDTRQADLAKLPHRRPPPRAVTSRGLLGREMPGGVRLNRRNLDDWIRPQLPPSGVTRSDQDASVWDWRIKRTRRGPLYLGEPEEMGPWPNLPNLRRRHPSAYPGDRFVRNRPVIRFNPRNGRPAYPLLRTHVGKRPPFSPNGHSGAPWLGERARAPAGSRVDPYAGRRDGLCPKRSPTRRYNVVAVDTPVQVTRDEADEEGRIFVLAHDKRKVRANPRAAGPLAIRANVGDCVAVTLTSEQRDELAFDRFAKVNMHIHHIQFDTQGSDGVVSGMQFEQTVRPYRLEDPRLTATARRGGRTLRLSSVAKFQRGAWIGVGLGTEGIEIRRIRSIDRAASTLRLDRPLTRSHPAGQWAGVEYVQYRWYPDVELDNVFFHDHVDGIHGWGHGLVAQLLVEPKGSTYHDPRTGKRVDSGTLVDIHTRNPLIPGVIDRSFREFVLFQIDENPVTDSTINLRAEPFSDRGGDPSLRFSSFTHGDPFTPIPRAYPGDPFMIRTINIGPSVDTLHLAGHRFFLEKSFVDVVGRVTATPIDTIHYGISERFSLALAGGAGGPREVPGDYLYFNGIGRRFEQGAWGILRVLRRRTPNLQPLPGFRPPRRSGGLPRPTGGRPPRSRGPGTPCPRGAPQHDFRISAVDLPGSEDGREAAFVPTGRARAFEEGRMRPEPLVMHVTSGECINVRFTNRRDNERASFHAGSLLQDPGSMGINVGFAREQTVAPGRSRLYRFYADTARVEAVMITDGGGDDSGTDGLYGAMVVSGTGARVTDVRTGRRTDIGTRVNVDPRGDPSYRDFTLIFADDDPIIGGSFMPYPDDVSGPVLINYREGRISEGSNSFSSRAHGDPPTPILRAHAGDPVRVHAFVAPGSEQMHVFNLGGMTWPVDPLIRRSSQLSSFGLGPWEELTAHVTGGAGGPGRAVGDFFYGDIRRPFTEGGMWGLFRVLPRSNRSLRRIR
ncbi:MAG: multicopper oxidase domain-containing protein [Actinomycetota bacterium]